MNPIFVPGEPPTYHIPRSQAEIEWQAAIREACPVSLSHPHLQFVVSSWLRRGNYFDLENLSEPVLDVIGKHATTVWASVSLSSSVGVYISEEIPPTQPSLVPEIYIATPPATSVRTTLLPQLMDREMIGVDEWLGISLAFDSSTVSVGDFSLSGPVKTLPDHLGPLLGTYYRGARDYRIRELRITTGHRNNTSGVTIGLWFL
jgi:hypothetical protein